MSRDDGEYPAIAWAGQNAFTGGEEIYVSVPTDTGWTSAERIDGVSDAVFPVVARDLNGDVWVAFHRDYQSGLWWCHTYTHATTSVPIATSDGAGVSVQWALSELAPETWWAVLRQRPDGTFEDVARIRAGNSVAMSWKDDNPPSGSHYRIRRECVDRYYEWLSDPSDTPVPALATLASAIAKPGQVELSWYAQQPTSATVYRRTIESDWSALGPAESRGDGLLTYTDRTVTAGRYAYRLGVSEQFTPETWVDVPSGYTLDLDGFKPNPAASAFQIAFTLSADSPATLDVYSVSGRRILTREIGSMGAGNHVIDLGTRAEMGPGVYWVRITQAGKTLTKKGVVTD
jgi:hypothetical protein